MSTGPAGGTDFFNQLCVVELGSWVAAPSASALLADLGAEVIKVEPPGGDPGRAFATPAGGGGEMGPAFALFNRSKRSVVLDLTAEKDRNSFEGLLAGADVFVTNMRDGSLSRIGLSPDAVMARHPHLVYASISGLGLRGEDRDRASYDVGAFWARSGLLHQITLPGSPPPNCSGAYGDLVTALSAFGGIVSALLARTVTGAGQVVESSLLRSGAWVMSGDLGVQAVVGRVHAAVPREECRRPLVNCYQTSDERWLFLLGVEAVRHLPGVCRAIGRPELVEDERFSTNKGIRTNRRDLIAALDEAFATRTLTEWKPLLDAEGVWWQAVATPAEVLVDPQLVQNDGLSEVLVGDPYPMVTMPFALRGQAPTGQGRAPALGDSNDQALAAFNVPTGGTT